MADEFIPVLVSDGTGKLMVDHMDADEIEDLDKSKSSRGTLYEISSYKYQDLNGDYLTLRMYMWDPKNKRRRLYRFNMNTKHWFRNIRFAINRKRHIVIVKFKDDEPQYLEETDPNYSALAEMIGE